jgi:hypothetical protein
MIKEHSSRVTSFIEIENYGDINNEERYNT